MPPPCFCSRNAGPLPLAGISDLEPYFVEIRFPDSWLPPRELLAVAACLAALEKLIAYRQRAAQAAADLFAPLAAEFAGLHSLASLLRLIESCIGGEEEILDDASLELADIRRRIVVTRKQLGESLSTVLADPELKPYIQDNLVTIPQPALRAAPAHQFSWRHSRHHPRPFPFAPDLFCRAADQRFLK